ncbi:MAG: HTH-type transcriptional activator ArnR [Candidatus Parvarchaeota archaeon]|nr:HTH-type transcriptional activator ArnR [Candidatus Rehaiarchaeum fermentans]
MIMGYNIFDTLRELDSMVDFARAKLQWDILFFINSKGPSSVSEIAEKTNNSKKAVIDAIRKLIGKELIVKVKYDVYDLSDKGRQVLNKLNELMNSSGLQNIVVKDSELDNDNIINPIQYFYLIELLKLSIINGEILSFDKAAKELGVSKQTLKYYIELFVNRKIFKRKTAKTIIGKTKQVYILTQEGKKLIYKMPSLVKIKNNVFLRILLRLTFSLRYETALIRLMAFLSISAPIVIYFKDSNIDYYFGIIWLYMLIFTSLLSIFAYINTK